MKLRLLLFEDCHRSCDGCCNKDYDLKNLPKAENFADYSEIILTGGEPMLRPDVVLSTIRKIRKQTKAPMYLYTAKVDDYMSSRIILNNLDGMTLTLHEQYDVNPLVVFNDILGWSDLSRSLRLNVFKGVDVSGIDLSMWDVRTGYKWIKNCPIPEDEVFMRLN